MINFLLMTLCCLFFAEAGLLAKPLNLEVNASSALLINADTGAILFEKNPHESCYPASITKIAVAAYVLNCTKVPLSKQMTAIQDTIGSAPVEDKRRSNYTLPAHWLEPGASHMGIKRGETLSLKDLLHGMMLISADDAANVIAHGVGGTIPEFMEQLNAYVNSLGCKKTYFANPHGLFHPKQQTTAYDMALITSQALKNPTFCEIIAAPRYTRPKTNKQEPTVMAQMNKLLQKGGKFYYPKAIGVKTGYIAAAQNTFVAAAKEGNRLLIAVLLKSKNRPDIFTDAIKLFEAAFNEKKISKTVIAPGVQKVSLTLEGAKDSVSAFTKEPVILTYYPAEEPQYKAVVVWDKVSLPIRKEQRIGEIRLLTLQGDTLQSIELFAEKGTKATWSYWFSNLL